MKKVLLSLGAALLMAAGAQAQVSYGIKAGVNLAKMSNFDNAKNNTGFYVTGFADLPVAPQFSIQPGVSLQNKGMKFNESETVGGIKGEITNKTSIMSLEVPVNAVYYIPTGASGSVFLGAGPYVGFNLSGKNKWDVATSAGQWEGGKSGKEDIKFGSKEDQMKVVDAGLNFMLGYKMSNGLLINAGYGLGLTNLSNVSGSDNKFSNRVLSFGIGFQL